MTDIRFCEQTSERSVAAGELLARVQSEYMCLNRLFLVPSETLFFYTKKEPLLWRCTENQFTHKTAPFRSTYCKPNRENERSMENIDIQHNHGSVDDLAGKVHGMNLNGFMEENNG